MLKLLVEKKNVSGILSIELVAGSNHRTIKKNIRSFDEINYTTKLDK